MAMAYLALGSNLGDREAMLGQALDRVGRLAGTRVVAVSGHHETQPVERPAGSGPFINAAAAVETSLGARELMNAASGDRRSHGPGPLGGDPPATGARRSSTSIYSYMMMR